MVVVVCDVLNIVRAAARKESCRRAKRITRFPHPPAFAQRNREDYAPPWLSGGALIRKSGKPLEQCSVERYRQCLLIHPRQDMDYVAHGAELEPRSRVNCSEGCWRRHEGDGWGSGAKPGVKSSTFARRPLTWLIRWREANCAVGELLFDAPPSSAVEHTIWR